MDEKALKEAMSSVMETKRAMQGIDESSTLGVLYQKLFASKARYAMLMMDEDSGMSEEQTSEAKEKASAMIARYESMVDAAQDKEFENMSRRFA